MLAELRRRHVFSVAGAYAVFAYIIVQVATNFFGALGLPSWTLRVTAYAALAGFPVAIALAWIFDITPEGVKRTAAAVLGTTPREKPARAVVQPADKSIAVLPFENMSDDADLEYFCDGMTEELLNALVRVPEVRVAARTSSFSYKGKHEDVRKIANELGVATVLEGSVRRSGSRIRITAQLINAEDGYHLWSDRYDREMSDVFAIQDEIADAIVRTLELKLAADALVKRGTVDQDAYHAYLRGRHFWNQRALPKAISQFEQAIAIDPDYALAYAGLADAYAFLGFYGYLPSQHAFERGKAAAARAIQSDPSLPEAYYSSGLIEFMFAWNFRNAEAAFLNALALSPRMANAHAQLVQVYGATGRAREAVAAAQEGIALEPLSTLVYASSGIGLLMAGRPAEAEQYCRSALEIDPHYVPALWVQAAALSTLGRHDPALEAAHRAVDYTQRNVLTLMWLGAVQAAAGRTAEAQGTLHELQQRSASSNVPPACIAWLAATLGDRETAVPLAIQALHEHSPLALLMRVLQVEPVASDARFEAALERAGVALPRRVTA